MMYKIFRQFNYCLITLSFLVTLTGCFSDLKFKEKGLPENPKKNNKDDLKIFSKNTSFWSSLKKTIVRDGKLYSLVFFKTAANSKIESNLVGHTSSGIEFEVKQLPLKFTMIDFDITPTGSLVSLGFSEIEANLDNQIFPLKELGLFIDGRQIAIFKDSKQNESIRYNKFSEPVPAKQPHRDRTLFITSSSLTEFARIKANDDMILVSAVGAFGFKAFVLDYSGNEVYQAVLLPQTESNRILLDTKAPYIVATEDRIFTAITTSKKDESIIKDFFNINLDWEGPNFQVLLHSFNLKLSERYSNLVKGSGDFFIAGADSDGKELSLFGRSGGAGNRKALAVVFDLDQREQYRSEFSIKNESSIYASTFFSDKLFVAGDTGSMQASTGSVIRPSDSFISSIDRKGKDTLLTLFGSQRDDRIISLHTIENKMFFSGNMDGPITHTADLNPKLGYQYWFFGKIK